MGAIKTGFKVVAGGFLAVVILGVGCTALIGNSVDKAVDKSDKNKTVEVKNDKGETKKEKVDGVTQENYDKIVQGDTLTGDGGSTKEEVIALLGEPKSTTESKTGDYKVELMSWSSIKNKTTVSVSVTNGKVSTKSISKF